MQDKQKVTLYLHSGVHRQLKIRAAIDEDSMSAIVEKAISFYLKYPEKVEEIEAATYGKTHQVYICPECEAAMVMRESEMVSLKHQPSVVTDEFPNEIKEPVTNQSENSDKTEKEALVTC